MQNYEINLWKKASRAATWLQLAPFVRFVAVTGSLGRGEAKPDSDADLFVVAMPGKLYTARAFALTILKLTGQRINVEANRVGGTVDPNYWLTSDHLDLQPHNAYVARDYSFMVPLWDSGDTYFRIMHMNPWVAEYQRKFRNVMPGKPNFLLRFIQSFIEGVCHFFGNHLERWCRARQEKNVRAFAQRHGKEEKVIISDHELRLHL